MSISDSLTIVVGAVLLAAGVVIFVGATDALNDLQQSRTELGGLAGLIFDLSDSLGASNFNTRKQLLEILRLTGVGGAVVGLVAVAYGLIRAFK